MSNKDNIKALQKENKELLDQVENLRKDLRTVQEKVTTNQELESSAEFFSKEYDNFKTANHDLAKISTKLEALSTRAELIEDTIETMLKYSYQYNVKIVGLPQADEHESAETTVDICIKLFNELGAKVDEKDIDIAHRSPNRKQNLPMPIICKFTRRIAKESVMKNKRNLSDVDLAKVVDVDESSESSSSTVRVSIFDHLTPNQTKLLQQAKEFQKANNYAFCWTKNQEILLKETPNSRVKKIKSESDLQALKGNILSSTLDEPGHSGSVMIDGPPSFPPPQFQPVQGLRGAWRSRGQSRGRYVTNDRSGPNTRLRASLNPKRN